jgi:hypothetical protein
MAAFSISSKESIRRLGLLDRTLIKVFANEGKITATEAVAAAYRLLTIDGLSGQHWTPGSKVQIALGSAFVARTYTPIDFDARRGSFRVLAFLHSEGPGAAWAAKARIGDPCLVFGPRASLDLGRASSPLFVFGDETSLGLFKAAPALSSVVLCAEVGEGNGARQAIQALGLPEVKLFERRADEGHLTEIKAQ